MEKIPEGQEFNYPILRFVEQDFIELVKIFSDNDLQPRIEIGGYKLDSLDEIKELKDRKVTNFEITGYNPLVQLIAYKSGLSLFLSDVDSTLQQGIKSKIEILFKKKRKMISNWDILFSDRIAIITIFACIGILIGKDIWLGTIFLIPIIVIWGYTYYNSLRKHVIVYLTKSTSNLTFWEKNGETIVVTIITTIIASIIAGLVLKLI
jgi:hypothetical protein